MGEPRPGASGSVETSSRTELRGYILGLVVGALSLVIPTTFGAWLMLTIAWLIALYHLLLDVPALARLSAPKQRVLCGVSTALVMVLFWVLATAFDSMREDAVKQVVQATIAGLSARSGSVQTTPGTGSASAYAYISLRCAPYQAVQPDYEYLLSVQTEEFGIFSGIYDDRKISRTAYVTCTLKNYGGPVVSNIRLSFAFSIRDTGDKRPVSNSELPGFKRSMVSVAEVGPSRKAVLRFLDDIPGKVLWLVPTLECSVVLAGSDARIPCRLQAEEGAPKTFLQGPMAAFPFRKSTDCFGFNPVEPKYQKGCAAARATLRPAMATLTPRPAVSQPPTAAPIPVPNVVATPYRTPTPQPTPRPSPTPMAVTFPRVYEEASPNPTPSGEPLTFHHRIAYDVDNKTGGDIYMSSCSIGIGFPSTMDQFTAASTVREKFRDMMKRRGLCSKKVRLLPYGTLGSQYVAESNLFDETYQALRDHRITFYYAGEITVVTPGGQSKVIPICGFTRGDAEVYLCGQDRP